MADLRPVETNVSEHPEDGKRVPELNAEQEVRNHCPGREREKKPRREAHKENRRVPSDTENMSKV